MQILICWTGCEPDWNAWAAIGSLTAAAATYCAVQATIRLHRETEANRARELKDAAEKASREKRQRAFNLGIQLAAILQSISGETAGLHERLERKATGVVEPLNDPLRNLLIWGVEDLETLMLRSADIEPNLARTILRLASTAKLLNAAVRRYAIELQQGIWIVHTDLKSEVYLSMAKLIHKWCKDALAGIEKLPEA